MSNNHNTAGRFRRLIAALLDVLILAGVAFLAIWPLGLFEHEAAYEPVQVVLRLLVLLVGTYLVVNGWLLIKRGQTIGKWMLGVKIIKADHATLIPLWKHLVRAFTVFLLAALTALTLRPIETLGLLAGLALIDALFIFGTERRCLHDRLVGSRVVRVSPETS